MRAFRNWGYFFALTEEQEQYMTILVAWNDLRHAVVINVFCGGILPPKQEAKTARNGFLLNRLNFV
jgi:hypothetical protein